MTYNILLAALQIIRNEDSSCECDGGPNCCIEADEFCPHCIADRAINAYLNTGIHQPEVTP